MLDKIKTVVEREDSRLSDIAKEMYAYTRRTGQEVPSWIRFLGALGFPLANLIPFFGRFIIKALLPHVKMVFSFDYFDSMEIKEYQWEKFIEAIRNHNSLRNLPLNDLASPLYSKSDISRIDNFLAQFANGKFTALNAECEQGKIESWPIDTVRATVNGMYILLTSGEITYSRFYEFADTLRNKLNDKVDEMLLDALAGYSAQNGHCAVHGKLHSYVNEFAKPNALYSVPLSAEDYSDTRNCFLSYFEGQYIKDNISLLIKGVVTMAKEGRLSLGRADQGKAVELGRYDMILYILTDLGYAEQVQQIAGREWLCKCLPLHDGLVEKEQASPVISAQDKERIDRAFTEPFLSGPSATVSCSESRRHLPVEVFEIAAINL